MSDFIKLLVALIGGALLAFGVVLVRPVVTNIAKFATEPASMAESAESFGELIGAENLALPTPQSDEKIEVGKVAAVGMLLFANIVWLWVPIGLIKAGASILLSVAKSITPSRDLLNPTVPDHAAASGSGN